MAQTQQSSKDSKTKAIILDFGGVIGTEVPRAFIQDIAVTEDLNVEELVAVWRDHFGPLLTGTISEDEFWLRFVDRLGVDKPIEEVIPEYKKLIRTLMIWDRQVLAYIKEIKTDHPNVTIAIASNNVREWMQDFVKRHDLSKYVDKQYWSYDLALRKPDQQFFDRICQDLGVKPQECIFIDNNEGNIEYAGKLGFVTHRYTALTQLKKFMEAAIIEKG